MPKKTKKQKIIAEYRKKIKLLAQTVSSPLSSSEQKPQSNETKTKLVSPGKKIETGTAEDEIIKNYFIQDFKKSFIVIFLIIALEIILYFVSIKNYLF